PVPPARGQGTGETTRAGNENGKRKSKIEKKRKKTKKASARPRSRLPITDSRLPARMTAVVKTKPLPGREGTQVKSVPVPRAGPGEVLIRVLATAVCGSDRHIYKWDESMATIVKPPRIPGHEFCGEIVRFEPGP